MDSSIRSHRSSSATITASTESYMSGHSNEEQFQEHYCGPFNYTCIHCRAVYFTDEITGVGNASRFYKCCKDGKVVLPGQCKITRYPEELKHLLTSDSDDAKNFRKYIRSYNTTFACASVRSNIVSPAGRGPYCFRIQGQMYH